VTGPSPAKSAVLRRLRVEEGDIYLAEYFNRPEIKIGFTLNLEQRKRTLFAPWDPGRIVATVRGMFVEEQAIHRALRHLSVRQVWPIETYPRSILSHPAIPAELRSAA